MNAESRNAAVPAAQGTGAPTSTAVTRATPAVTAGTLTGTLLLAALGAMSITWMAVITILACTQKLLPPKAAIDAPLALAIIGLGAWILIAPASVPRLLPAM